MADTYAERIAIAREDIDNLLADDPDADVNRFILELADTLTPGGTYETLLFFAEMFAAGDVSLPWEVTKQLQGRIQRGIASHLVAYAANVAWALSD